MATGTLEKKTLNIQKIIYTVPADKVIEAVIGKHHDLLPNPKRVIFAADGTATFTYEYETAEVPK